MAAAHAALACNAVYTAHTTPAAASRKLGEFLALSEYVRSRRKPGQGSARNSANAASHSMEWGWQLRTVLSEQMRVSAQSQSRGSHFSDGTTQPARDLPCGQPARTTQVCTQTQSLPASGCQ